MQKKTGRIKNGVSAVGQLLGEGLSQLQIERKIREHTAPLIWAEIVGPQIAGATEVLGVQDGVLRVSTASSVWASELNFYKVRILRDLNAKLGARPGADPIIKEILFQNRGLRRTEKSRNGVRPPLSPTPEELGDVELSLGEIETIDAGIVAITDPDLRERLRRVRIADARLRTWRLDNAWLPCPACGDLAPPYWDAAAGEIVPGEADCPCRRVARHRGR